MQRIVEQVTTINSVIAEIASSAQAQAIGLQEVNTAVGHMDVITQQNAAMAEEATAAGRSLAQESEHLATLIGRFDVSRDQGDSLRDESRKVAPHAFRSGRNTSAG